MVKYLTIIVKVVCLDVNGKILQFVHEIYVPN